MTTEAESEELVLPRSRKYGWLENDWWLIKRCDELEREASKEIIGKDDRVSTSKIQRVPGYMRGRVEFENFYLPKLISIGPIHFGQPYVELGERYKIMWTAMYLHDTKQTVRELREKILDHFDELKQLYSSDCFNYEYRERDVCWMLLLDGCSILRVLEKSYNCEDPEQVLRVRIDQLVRVHQDLLLLENQIPYKLLKLLCDDQARLKKCMDNFLQIHGIEVASRNRIEEQDVGGEKGELQKEHKLIVEGEAQDEDEPVHLLDYLRRALLMRDRAVAQIHGEKKKRINHNQKSLHLRKYRIGTIRELKAAGIRVTKDPYGTSFYPSFVDGKLQLPEFTVDGTTAFMLLNLIAYEMCPDFRNDFEISSYIVFLSSLIDQPEDVKELRSAGILRNELANDKEVADLFNKMDTVLVPETATFAHIRDEIDAYFRAKSGRIKMLGWMGEAYNTYFHSPWTIIALLAAVLGLALTFIQTWFAIHPKSS